MFQPNHSPLHSPHFARHFVFFVLSFLYIHHSFILKLQLKTVTQILPAGLLIRTLGPY